MSRTTVFVRAGLTAQAAALLVVLAFSVGDGVPSRAQGPGTEPRKPAVEIKNRVTEGYPDRLQARLEQRARALRAVPAQPGLQPQFIITLTKRWDAGQTVTVAFKGGDAMLHRDIEQAVSEWTQYANLKFDFKGGDGQYRTWSPADQAFKADIRVSFDQRGYYSLVGTDSIDPQVSGPGEESLNLSGFDVRKPSDWKAVALHEFGHAIGFEHEHQSPIAPCDFRFDDDAGYVPTTDQFGQYVPDAQGRNPGLYTVLGGPPNNWPQSKVDHNLRKLPPSSAYEVGPFDKDSIMKYFFPAWMFALGTDSACFTDSENARISDGDRKGAAKAYPAASRPEEMRATADLRRKALESVKKTPGLSAPVQRHYQERLDGMKDRSGVAPLPMAPTPTAQADKVRDEFARFFELRGKLDRGSAAVLGERRVQARAAVEKSPKSADQRKRLLAYQEERTAQPDMRKFLADNPVLEEVSAGEDREFAQVLFWNEIALHTTANDHTPVPAGLGLETHPFEQVGPVRTSRAMAIVHIAMFEAANAIHRKYNSYQGIQKQIFAATGLPADLRPDAASARHAIAYAAYRTLLALYPGKAADLSLSLAANLTAIQETGNRATTGLALGEAAARAILDLRKFDGSELPDPDVANFLTPDSKKWQRDPLSDIGVALGANWPRVKPFVIKSADAFRPEPPPMPGSQAYAKAFKDVYDLGGDPDGGNAIPPGNSLRRPTKTTRTDEQTFVGKFWAYDGTALLCAPPRLYNMIATSLALNEQRAAFPDALELARYLALVNLAMADAGLSAWEAKYFYLYPRPVTAIRATTPDSGLVAVANPFWTPLGAPVTNAQPGRLNFTPPFPAYPSGHAVFGGALFQILRNYFPDATKQKFTFVSDEYNGRNSDPGSAAPRPRKPRTFDTFKIAAEENARSRIYLGIHWQFDADAGVDQGTKVAAEVFKNAFTPVK